MILRYPETLEKLQRYCYEIEDEIKRAESSFGSDALIPLMKEVVPDFLPVDREYPHPIPAVVISLVEAKEFLFALERKRVELSIRQAVLDEEQHG